MRDLDEIEEELIDYAKHVLRTLESHEEWNADTIDDIGCAAIHRNLARTDNNGLFRSNV